MASRRPRVGGRYWARTSDPQLVDSDWRLARERPVMDRSGLAKSAAPMSHFRALLDPRRGLPRPSEWVSVVTGKWDDRKRTDECPRRVKAIHWLRDCWSDARHPRRRPRGGRLCALPDLSIHADRVSRLLRAPGRPGHGRLLRGGNRCARAQPHPLPHRLDRCWRQYAVLLERGRVWSHVRAAGKRLGSAVALSHPHPTYVRR